VGGRRGGHHYRLDVTVEGPVGLDGMVVDFDTLAATVSQLVVSRYDHQLLNDFLENPTAEVIAAEAWKILEGAGLAVVGMRLWETPDSMVELLP
jgi:6-pyruvoyltetrahydropterin/6-carboxytetrahydropterin synthase